jgi:hypothetical protein
MTSQPTPPPLVGHVLEISFGIFTPRTRPPYGPVRAVGGKGKPSPFGINLCPGRSRVVRLDGDNGQGGTFGRG